MREETRARASAARSSHRAMAVTSSHFLLWLLSTSPYARIGRNCSASVAVCGDVTLCEAGMCRECREDWECQVDGPERSCLRYNHRHLSLIHI